MSDDSMLFPQKLMDILDDPSNKRFIYWLPDGKSFAIRDRSLFAEIVMPKYFSRKAKFSSFTRKLNRWNFKRVANGPEPGAYFHKYFLRDQPHFAAQMFCKNARTMLAMKSSSVEATPDVLKNKKPTRTVLVTEPPLAMPIMASTPQIPSLPSSMCPMKTQSISALKKSHFAASIVPTIMVNRASAGCTDRQALEMQQEKEQLNRLLIERVLRLQQHTNAVMQQDRLLQMRRMIEINMQQHRLQQQQQNVEQQRGNNDGPTRLGMNNRASAA